MNHPSGVAKPRIDGLLAEVRMHLDRVLPEHLDAEVVDGAVVVDTRPAAVRVAEGEFPGALIVERNVLEWRFDPTSPARLPQATSDDVRVIVVCNDGYASSLAARSLQLLGLHRATDLVGGYRAWRALHPRHDPPKAPTS
jgi:rhodanese-related sulfurtransferase